MKKPLVSPFIGILLALVILAGLYILYSVSTQELVQEPLEEYPASVNRDCAPWDGTAFTVNIPLEDGTSIRISIWHSADEIKSPVTFQFPDTSGQAGNASLIQNDMPRELTGEVTFQNAQTDAPLEGQFDLQTGDGQRFTGKFKAEWGNNMFLCG